MKPFFIFVFLVFALLTIPVQGNQYLTEAQKELLLGKSRALGQTSKKEQAQNASKQSEQTNIVKQQSRPVRSRQTKSRYIGYSSNHSTLRTSTAANNSRTQTQSFQSAFKNADWGTPTNSNRSVQQSRQVAKAKKKFNWSGFFKGLGQVAEAINNSTINTNSQVNMYTPPQTNIPSWNSQPNYTHSTNKIMNTMKVGNQTMSVGGNNELRTWDVGNQTFGTFNGKEVKMYNFGNFSHGTIGDQKVRCHMAGNIKFCK